jgi:hypothetical protein
VVSGEGSLRNTRFLSYTHLREIKLARSMTLIDYVKAWGLEVDTANKGL